MVVTWDNDSSSKKELDKKESDEIAKFYFMVKDQENKVTNDELKFSLSYDKLHDSFENLIENFDIILKKYFLTIE